MVLLAAIGGGAAYAQNVPPPAPAEAVPAPASPEAVIVQNPAAQCVQPAPVLELSDYNGPFAKTVGFFVTKMERRTVHPPHYKPGVRLCSLDPGDKLVLFVRDAFDPVTFIAAGFDGGFSQAVNWDPSFGQGGAGYGKRFGASFVDHTSGLFFKDFAYPTIFSEDPRYYRQAEGSGQRRLWHAVNHAFVAHQDNGWQMFNISEWVGTISAETLSNTYHPGNGRGVGPAAERGGLRRDGRHRLRRAARVLAGYFEETETALPRRTRTTARDGFQGLAWISHWIG